MSNIGIPTWVFQVQPRNSEAREPTSVTCKVTLLTDRENTNIYASLARQF